MSRRTRGALGNDRWRRQRRQRLCREHEALLGVALLQNPGNPRCPGPVVIHVDGQVECHGGCDGVATAFHVPGTTAACDVIDQVVELVTSCRRCAA